MRHTSSASDIVPPPKKVHTSDDAVPTFIKWAGGKTQLLRQFQEFYPRKFHTYFEPFLGSAAVFFHLAGSKNITQATLSDSNAELITTFNVVKDNVQELIDVLNVYKKNHSKKYYYHIRSLDPETLSHVTLAARFIYLNKTCFNGLYRVNSQGVFNVPMGSYNNPSILVEKNLRQASHLLQKTTIVHRDFTEVLAAAKKGDFVYFDPPYKPLSKTSSFTSYTKFSFTDDHQKQLAELFTRLDKNKVNVMLSNSDCPFIRNLYAKFTIHTVHARRMINCDATKRGAISEVVVTNYTKCQSR